MSKETSNIPQSISFVSVYRVVIILKRGFEAIKPYAIQFAESLADKPIKIRVRSFLRTTFNNHLDKFDLDLRERTIDLKTTVVKYLLSFFDLYFQ
jgi:hypothetical protein